MDIQSIEPMTLGSPTSPKPGAQFLPGFLMGDLPAPVTPQPRSFGLTGGGAETRSPFLAGGSPPQLVVPTPKDKSGAPPVRSIYDDLNGSGVGVSPLAARKQPFAGVHTPLSGLPGTPGTVSNLFSPAGQQRKTALSPAQVDPFFTQGDALSSEDQLDDTWVTVFGFPPASASYILLQFAQYGNILKHVMSNTGNWMHVRYQSKLQARKALSKDGKIFGEAIMIGVKPCIDKSVMESLDKSSASSSVFTPPVKAPGTPSHPLSTPRSVMRPLSAAYKASSSDYQVSEPRSDQAAEVRQGSQLDPRSDTWLSAC
uniref:Nucleoporin NUP53 n=1 Tax=Cyprinus carpio TaxID=7962 RepID=A0A8C2ARL7_CYPCA